MFTFFIAQMEEEIKEKSDSDKGYFSEELHLYGTVIDDLTTKVWKAIDEQEQFINDIHTMIIKKKAHLTELHNALDSYWRHVERTVKDKEENNGD